MSRNKVIARAQELVTSGWIKYDMAADAKDRTVNPYSSDATCFCAVGALARALQENKPRMLDPYQCVDAFLGEDARRKLMKFNDARSTTRQQVLAALEALKE